MGTNFTTPAGELAALQQRTSGAPPQDCHLFRPGDAQPVRFIGNIEPATLRAAIADRLTALPRPGSVELSR